MRNPPYNNARGAAALSGVPPFEFDGVVMRVFPLKANIHALSRFCDQYLNLMPEEIACFKPAIPYVFLAAINYGRMSGERSNLGWVAQNEVAFSVLLNWFRRDNGKLVFQDWASVSPFIFVDDESSLMTGREVYGWPKTLAWLTPGIPEWTRSPRAAESLFVLSSMVFPQLFAGQRQEPRVLLEILHQPPPGISGMPPDPFSRLNPLLGWPEALAEGMALASSMFETVARPPLSGYGTEPLWQSLPEMLSRGGELADVISRLPVFNTMNLKQFRDSRDAAAACYQGVTCAPMKVTRYVDGALLGEPHQLTGDPSGGYRLRIHRYPTQPIVESLGLEVSEENTERDHDVVTLTPSFPFWVELDLHYGRGRLVCWRTSEIDWRTGEAGAEEPAVAEPEAAGRKHPYNTARGAATQAIAGPFRFPNVTQRVLPLLADWFRLERFCAEYLDNDYSFFEPWGSYVYLNVMTFEEMSSETYNVGWWAHRLVRFSFPVKWFHRRGRERQQSDLLGVAMVTPFAYTDSDLGATTGREVQGLPMVKAAILSPRSSWLEDSGPARRSEMLQLRTKVFAGLHAGQEMQERLLLEVTRRDVLPSHDDSAWKSLVATWGERLYAELYTRSSVRAEHPERFDAVKALALELLRGDAEPFNEISLRQFRDVEEPERACYQSITLTRTTIEELFELAEIEDRMHVAIHRYPTQPIVETLGLRIKRTDASGGSVVDYLQPMRPFWARLALRMDLGEDVFWRAASKRWVPSSFEWRHSLSELRQTEPDRAALRAGRTTPRSFYLVSRTPEVGAELSRAIDRDDSLKRDLRPAWRFWRWRPGFPPGALLSTGQARAAVGDRAQPVEKMGSAPRDVEPQMVLESILSNEWGRRSQPRGGARKLPEICMPARTFGNRAVREAYKKRFGFAEKDHFWFVPQWERDHARPAEPGESEGGAAADSESGGDVGAEAEGESPPGDASDASEKGPGS